MDRRYLLLGIPVIVCVALANQSATAGILWGKKAKPTPAEYVPELIRTLKNDGDERKRCAAAEELRQYDPLQFPDMVPALIDALLVDKKPSVRAEAAQSLGKLRPVTTPVGAALEQALAKDTSMRVRLQARSSLLQYRWAGYAPKGKDEAPSQSKEPPLAADLQPPPAQTGPPRLAPVPATTASLPSSPRPLPVGTPVKRTQPAAAPANTPEPGALPVIPMPPGTTPAGDTEKGPDLTPP
jgi:hypothetical protein